MAKQVMKPVAGTPDDLTPGREYVYQPKLDGIRFHVRLGQLLSYTNKPIPNVHLQSALSVFPDGTEGELIVGSQYDSDFQSCSSIVMSKDKPVESITAVLFDNNREYGSYEQRLDLVERTVSCMPLCCAVGVEVVDCHPSIESALSAEGAIVRALDGQYKWGRATKKEGTLFKVKKFEDTEALVVGWEPLLTNTNPQKVDEAGHLVRSSHKDGKIMRPLLGKVLVKHPVMGEFAVGSGITLGQREYFYENPSYIMGHWVKIKYFGTTKDGKPRHPIFLGVRSTLDFDIPLTILSS